MNAFPISAVALLLYLLSNIIAHAEDYICKDVGHGWAWFGDHVAVRVTYLVVAQSGRLYETATGVSYKGKPRGTRKVRSGTATFHAFGAGALHIRVADTGGPAKICATAKKISPITIIDREF